MDLLMDLVSRLLTLMPVTGTLDTHCQFGAAWRIDGRATVGREIAWHVLLSGTAILEDDDGPLVRMEAGDVVLFPAGRAHVLHDGSGKAASAPIFIQEAGFGVARNGSDSASGAAAELLCGRFLLPSAPRQLLREYLPERVLVRGRSLTSVLPVDDQLARVIQLMHEEVARRRPGCKAVINHLCGALFVLALRFASNDLDAPRSLLALTNQPHLRPAIDAMFDEPSKPWTLPDLAALCRQSRATFMRNFNEASGRSASDLLMEIRMAIAARCLAQTELTIGTIGMEVGYWSKAAFHRAFKRYAGVTPAQWRQTYADEHPASRRTMIRQEVASA
ncbi:AraC family transcriptional regulator [Paraburkholderia sp. ZP32-5]|uniref:AraC family transcriptional regulator n=1 Tax=Paraburkholderia sp. ZP32-5 TaxID=2883245 RepID=UPI001F345E89|nr:AraC family transcriptional regulator [Paraburkholderia sp. ZP32-5]